MSILDHSHSYGSTMDYKENPSTHLNGKFFWFSGYCDMNVKKKPYNGSTHDETGNSVVVNNIAMPSSYDRDIQDEIDKEEIEHNINIVNELIAELTENEDVDEDTITPTVISDVSHEPIHSTHKSQEFIDTIPRLELTSEKLIHNNNEKKLENNYKSVPSKLWFKYNDEPVIEKPPQSILPRNLSANVSEDILPSKSIYNTNAGNCECPKDAEELGGVYFKLHASQTKPLVPHLSHEKEKKYDISKRTGVTENNLISSIDDLISEVNSDRNLSFCKSKVSQHNENNEVSDIPTIESLEKALADIENNDKIRPYITEHISIENTNQVMSENISNSDNDSGVFMKSHNGYASRPGYEETDGILSDVSRTVVHKKCTDSITFADLNVKDNIMLSNTKHSGVEDGKIKPKIIEEDVALYESTGCLNTTNEHIENGTDNGSNLPNNIEYDDVTARNVGGGIFFKLQVENVNATESIVPSVATSDDSEDVSALECPVGTHNETSLNENVETTSLHEESKEADVNNITNFELNNKIYQGVPEGIIAHEVCDKDPEDLGEAYSSIGTWFGFSGRTYRAKPMENLLDIDVMDDATIDSSKEDACNDICNSPFIEHDPYELDFRDKNISLISEISEMSEDSLNRSSFETDLTLVTPLKQTENTGLLKLCQEPLDDDVFIEPEVFSNAPESTGNSFDDCYLTVSYATKSNSDDEKIETCEISELLATEGDMQPLLHVTDHNFDSSCVESIKTDEAVFESPPTHKKHIDSTKNNNDSESEIEKRQCIIDGSFENDEHTLHGDNHPTTEPICDESFIDASDDEECTDFNRGTSFRRSIVIEDEVSDKDQRRPSGGATHVSAFYCTPISPREELEIAPGNKMCNRARELLNYLDNILINEETFGRDFEVVKKLHSLFWELRDGCNKNKNVNNPETLSTVLNYMVVQEWPKVFVGVFRKLKLTFPHVFLEHDPEGVVYYSGHLPTILRMNRTSSEFAVAVIFDGLLMSAINFTDVHEASRQASCEDDLISYLLKEIMPHLNSIHWGKATAKEMFLKSICDLIYNCCQSPSNASYMIDNDLVNIFTMMRDEISGVMDARRINMTMLLSLSYLIDDNNYDRIVPGKGCILQILQFLDKSLEHSEHTYLDFYAAELAGCLSKIASHYSNKVLITRNSGQEILHKLLKCSYDNEEKVSACEALWNTSFSREAKGALREMDKLMNLLRELKKSDDFIVRNMASGVIWECEEKYDIQGTRDTAVRTPQHIMISYEYESQPLVISVRDELKRLGFNVWMASSVSEYDLHDVMTKGVEGASVVIVALTRKYKQEPHSFAEIDYAHSLRKTIIPIIIDTDFMPDGWLNQHIKQEKTFDFSRRSMFNGSLDALAEYLKEISDARGDSSTIAVNIADGEVKKVRSTDVLAWSNCDVIDWLKENRLIRTNNTGGRLQKLTGFHLLMFYDLKKETPDYYYSVLDSHLGFKDVLDTLEFTYALDRLLGTERLI